MHVKKKLWCELKQNSLKNFNVVVFLELNSSLKTLIKLKESSYFIILSKCSYVYSERPNKY